MLTMAKHKHGEGTLKTFNPEVGHASRRKKIAEEEERDEHEKKLPYGLLSHVRNVRANVWRL